MKKTVIYLLFASIVSTVTMLGQSKGADKQYDGLAYVNAIKTYERLVNKNIKNVEILQKLGNSYYFNADLLKAGTAYKQLFEMNQEVEPEYYYRYSQCLKASKDYKAADDMLIKFNQKSGNDARAKLATSQKDYLAAIMKNSGRYSFSDAGINSPFSDYGSAFYNGKVIFASARKKSDTNENYAGWTGEKFTDLYQADMDLSGNLSNVSLFSSSINTKYHESTPIFTKDGKTVYFTRNNYFNGKKGNDSKKTTLLKIYKATIVDGKWTNMKPLPFNSDEYNVAHPALSKDEKTLYFASDMTGTLGQSDLFKVSINGDDTYGTPVNLGNKINTEGRETFPFIDKNDQLFFASDGQPGLGGLDIYSTSFKNGNYTGITNLGEPVNSSFDDFSFILDDSNRRGYVTSNREKGKGNDDIYKIQYVDKTNNNDPSPENCVQNLIGVVTDQTTGNVIPAAKVVLFDSNIKEIKQTVADGNGKYDFGVVPCGSKYYIRSSAPEYITVENPVNVSILSGTTYAPSALGKLSKLAKEGDDLAKLLDIPMIYFDLDKSFIRKDAAIELSKILDVMEQNPTLKIDVRSHTDSRNTFEYNVSLSDRRVKSTIAWLIKKGISASRLTGRGYGESQLTNGCADGVKCSEEEHQLNRRSEFIIVKK